MYGPVLGASTTTVAALTLANTGFNKLVVAVLAISIIFTVVGLARIVSDKATS